MDETTAAEEMRAIEEAAAQKAAEDSGEAYITINEILAQAERQEAGGWGEPEETEVPLLAAGDTMAQPAAAGQEKPRSGRPEAAGNGKPEPYGREPEGAAGTAIARKGAQTERDAEAAERYAYYRDFWTKAYREAAREQFDIAAAVKDPAFSALINHGIPFAEARRHYGLDATLSEAERRGADAYAETLRARRGAPRPIRATQAGGVDMDLLTDQQILAIDARLKRGERARL